MGSSFSGIGNQLKLLTNRINTARPALIVAGLTFALSANLNAAIVTTGNLLVVDVNNSSVQERQRNGTLVQSFAVPPTGGITETTRGLALGGDGLIQVYNGTFNPTLTTIDPTVGSRLDTKGVGFSTANTLGFGHVATSGSRVFVTDDNTVGSTDKGIVTFDFSGGVTSSRFATDFAPSDLITGKADGLLYSLGIAATSSTTTPNLIRIYNPSSLSFVRDIVLPAATSTSGLRGFATRDGNEYFAIRLNNQIVRLDINGAVVETFAVPGTVLGERFIDIDLSQDGAIAVSSDRGSVFLTDTTLTSSTSFIVNGDTNTALRPVYLSFAEVTAVPEPGSTLALTVLSLAGIVTWRRRRSTAPIA